MRDFEKIYKEYYPQIYYFLFGLCGNKDCAEELTQETFLKALKNIDKFRGECKISSWLCQIAKNSYYTYVRKNKEVATDGEIIREQNVDSIKSVEEIIIDRDCYLNIQEILHEIGNPYDEVFWMRAFLELSFSQIASKYNKTESWARVTYHRAKVMIKERLK